MTISSGASELGKSLRLVMGSLAIFDADAKGDHEALARLLEVSEITEWPPTDSDHDADAVNFFRQTLEGDPAIAPWLAYYVCINDVLVGSAGFMGPPEEGTAEIGYSICTHSRRKGFATATVERLAQMAKRENVRTLIASVRYDNAESIGLLKKLGFAVDDADDEQVLFTLDLTRLVTAPST
jgi:[ribosomal protein S5]-alanine N-acetyltransferase